MRAHERALARVAIAAAAEDHREPAAAMRARRRQRLAQRIGRVRVVDHRERRLRAAESFHAAGRGAHARERARCTCSSGMSQSSRTAMTVSRLSTLKSPTSGHDEAAGAPARIEFELDAAHRQRDVHGAHETRGAARARLVAAAGDDHAAAAARIDGELPAERVVDVDHARHQVFAHEQPRLGGAVAFHGAVIVEVVAREIGERGGAEPHRAHARLVERVRGNFHRHAGRAAGAQAGERALHGDRRRRW